MGMKGNPMAQMNVSVPDPMKEWCEQQVKLGRYSTTSDYVRDLIRHDQSSQREVSALQALIDEGFASKMSNRTLNDILADAKKWTIKVPNHGN